MSESERAKPVPPEELAALRDGLAAVLAKLADSRTLVGWLRQLTANPIASAETVRLLERCRDAFDSLLQEATPPVPESPAEDSPPDPAPEWLKELEATLNGAEGRIPAALRDRLRGWRSEEMAERLESATIELHIHVWDGMRGEWEQDDPEHARRFSDRLAAVLAGQFGLTPFCPVNFQDHPPGWVQVAAGSRMTTGRVREVLRPGLLDRDGGLRVPARVSVE